MTRRRKRRKAKFRPITGKDQRWVYIMQRQKKRKFEIRIIDILVPAIAVACGIYFYGVYPIQLSVVFLVAFLLSISSQQNEYKIGIAKNPDWRHKDVDQDVPGKVKLVRSRFVPNARSLEKKLHSIFSDSRFTMKRAGRNAGATEWFYMTDVEYATLEYLLFYYSAESKIAPWIIMITLAILSIIYISTTLQ